MAFDSTSPLPPTGRSYPKGYIRKIERFCSRCITSIPLVFVYGLTTWAAYVEIKLSLAWISKSHLGYFLLFLGITFYVLLNWSYTVASFTDPGTPASSSTPFRASAQHEYSYLPTHESFSEEFHSVTVKSSGGARYCKKCHTKKPDRAHHCSSCGRCVLKMDHHCPWLATCVGFRNYKPFLLFCIYVTVFCWICFAVSGIYLWTELLEADISQNALFGINTVLLVVLSGIFGLVLTGFTGWHMSLAWRNQTTIECLEKTRYLSPIRRGINRAQHVFDANPGEGPNIVQRYGQQLTEMHANAIPGVTRPEEGEERPSPVVRSHQHADQLSAMEALRMNYNDMELENERRRYENYLDEQDSEKLPNAFDLGWKKNLRILFGEQKLLWFLPVCNTLGDGWHFEPSARWIAEHERISLAREVQLGQRASSNPLHGDSRPEWTSTVDNDEDERFYLSTSNGIASLPWSARRSPGKANQVLGRSSDQYADDFGDGNSGMPLRTLKRQELSDDVSSVNGIYSRDEYAEQSGDSSDNATSVGERGRDEWRNWD